MGEPHNDIVMSCNDDERMGFDVAVVACEFMPGHWLCEAVDDGSEGEVYRATFDGHNAEARAYAYAFATFGSRPSSTGGRE